MSYDKKSRLVSDDNEDRISNLQEDVLSHILSSLPTKDVFRTSVLSKQWRYKWRLSYNMAVCDHDRRCKSDSVVQLMNRLLFFQQRMSSFSLDLRNDYDSSRVHTWISKLLNHKLQTLEVKCYSKTPVKFVFPGNLLNNMGASAMRKLLLCHWSKYNYELAFGPNFFTISVAVKNCAPNLTSLFLSGVDIVNGHPSDSSTIKFSFRALETLRFESCRWLDVKLVEIEAPSLITFESSSTSHEPDKNTYSIQIAAPRLANFWSTEDLPQKYVFCKGTGGSSIVSAVFNTDIDMDYTTPELKLLHDTTGLQVGNHLNNFTNLEELELSDFIAKTILPLTSLRLVKLRRLKLVFPSNAKIILGLLHAAPSLKFLSIMMWWCIWDEDDGRDYVELFGLPTCIQSHLKEIEILDFELSDPGQEHLVKFFMDNGEQLDKLRVVIKKTEDLVEAEELLSFPRCSPSLTIDRVLYANFVRTQV